MNTGRIVMGATLLGLLAGFGCGQEAEGQIPPPLPPAASAAPAVAAPVETAEQRRARLVETGAQLVRIGGCNDCHTPMKLDPELKMPVPDTSRMLSGHPEGAPEPASSPSAGEAVIGATMTAFRLPFGTVYAPNLTPDPKTGIGEWKRDEFVRAMRTGQHKGDPDGRPILPPMPWANAATFQDEELDAIWAYLKSVPAIENRVPEPKVPAPVLDGIKKSYAGLREKMAAQKHALR